MTRRERMERRAERRDDWATSARRESDARFSTVERIASGIPFGQPILVGHHSEAHARRDQERIQSNMGRAVEAQHRAERHGQVADELRRQLDGSIFSDDADALDQLAARIAAREAERDRIRRYNVTCRAAAKRGEPYGDLTILDDAQRRNIEGIRRVCPFQVGPGGAFPAYVLSNLGGRIKADRDRLEAVKRQQVRAAEAEATPGGVLVRASGDYAVVTFAEKPSRDVLDALRAAGFWWGRGSWSGPADKLPQAVRELTEGEEAPMAAGRLPKPGTKFGPCVDACGHRDCAETRTMAARVCPICEKAIGYDVRFYQHSGIGELTHAACLENQVRGDR